MRLFAEIIGWCVIVPSSIWAVSHFLILVLDKVYLNGKVKKEFFEWYACKVRMKAVEMEREQVKKQRNGGGDEQ